MSFLVRSILVVSSNGEGRASITRLFTVKARHYAVVVSNGAAALDFVKSIKPHLLLVDYRLSDMNGLDLYDLVHETQGLADVPAIIVGVPLPRQTLAVITRQQLVLLNSYIDLQALLSEMSNIVTSNV